MDALTTHVEHRTTHLQQEAHVRRLAKDRPSRASTPTGRARHITLAIAATVIAVSVGATAYGASLAQGRGPDDASARLVLAIVGPVRAHR